MWERQTIGGHVSYLNDRWASIEIGLGSKVDMAKLLANR